MLDDEAPGGASSSSSARGADGRWRGERGSNRSCRLHWQPGALCFTLPNVTWVLPNGESVPGLSARLGTLGYRAVAGASGTTANILQMGEVSFSPIIP